MYPKFNLRPIIEQKPFKNAGVQEFFAEWCKINDYIELKVISREEWNQRLLQNKKILENVGNKKYLFIPDDLCLWEIVGVVEAIDKNNFGEIGGKITKETKERIQKLARLFKNSGIYIIQRLNDIKEGKEIARALAEEFYEYGTFLENGKETKIPPIEEIAKSVKLTEDETEEVDKFLAGRKLYKSRKFKVEKNLSQNSLNEKEFYEKERVKTLQQFFKLVHNAFVLKNISNRNTPDLRPWQENTSIHNSFLQKVYSAIKQEIEAPKVELTASIFRIGLELINKFMSFDKLPKEIKEAYLEWKNGEVLLRKALKIEKLKKELEEVRLGGNYQEIAKKEKEIADTIQTIVYNYPKGNEFDKPLSILQNQHINCVGASILGGVFMKEIGLNYLVGGIPHHSIILLVRSDGKIEWRDMIWFQRSFILGDDVIGDIDIQDIKDFSEDWKLQGLLVKVKQVKNQELKSMLDRAGINTPFNLYIMHPEYGQLVQLLTNLSNAFLSRQHYKAAIGALQQALNIQPGYLEAINNLGVSFVFSEKCATAIKEFKKALRINPFDAMIYCNLARVYMGLKKYKYAIQVLKRALETNQHDSQIYGLLGDNFYLIKDYNQAIKFYKKAIQLGFTSPRLYSNLGLALMKAGQYEDAVIQFQEAMNLQEDFIIAYYYLGNAFTKIGDYKKAKQFYNKFLLLLNNDDNKEYHYYKGKVERKLQELEKKLKEETVSFQ